MPQQNQSGKIGKSSSPTIQRVVDNNKNVQQVVPTSQATKPSVQYNKRPVKV